jgi:phosphate transport system substrate-binding protein
MKLIQVSRLLPALALATGLVLASGSEAYAQATIKIDGSSTVFPITEAVSEEFQAQKKGAVRVTVGISGTGGGFKKFCRGETDVQDASRPISKTEMEDCKKAGIKYFELPIAYDALTVAVSPKNTWVKDITVEDLKKIWAPEAQGKITKWNQVRPEWPDAPLKLFGAGSDSGTFDYFTEAIVGKAKSSRGDYTASEDDNTIVQGISNDKNALGYLPYAYYEPNKARLKVLAIDGGEKAPKKGAVLPSAEAVENGTYFPLSRPLFIYVSEKSLQKPEVKEFINFFLANGGELAKQVKYVSLPKKAYDLANEHLKKGKMGTVFGGHSDVGLKIEDLMKREASL